MFTDSEDDEGGLVENLSGRQLCAAVILKSDVKVKIYKSMKKKLAPKNKSQMTI